MRLFFATNSTSVARAARNDQIHVAIEREQFQHIGARLKQIDRIQRNAGKMAKAIAPDGHQRFVGMRRLRAALENDRVAGLQRERRDLRNHFGPRLENDADHAERAGLLVEHQPFVEFGRREPAPQRIGQAGHFTHLRGHLRDAAFGDAQARKHGGGHFARRDGRFSGAAIELRSRREFSPCFLRWRLRRRQQHFVARLRRKRGERPRRFAGALRHLRDAAFRKRSAPFVSCPVPAGRYYRALPARARRLRFGRPRVRIFLVAKLLGLRAGAIGNAARKLAPFGIDDAHHIHRREMAFDAHDSRRKQARLALRDGAMRPGIHDHAAANIGRIGDPAPLSAHALRGQKCRADIFAGKDAARCVSRPWPLAITAVPPQFMAISAASSFVRMPPRPLAEGPAASAFSSGVTSSTRGITSSTSPLFDAMRHSGCGCLPQQAIHVGQQHQRIGFESAHHERGEAVVVAEDRRSRFARSPCSSSAVETVSFSLTMGRTPKPSSFSIVRRRFE